MVKVGEVHLGTQNDKSDFYYIVWYSQDSYERIDLIKSDNEDNPLDKYNPIDTSSCVASYVQDTTERIYGDLKLVTLIKNIRKNSAFLPVQEKRNAEVKDGKFILKLTKESPDESIYYEQIQEMGNITYEKYVTTDGAIEINSVRTTNYNYNNRPINWEDYEVLNTFNKARADITIRHGKAEFRPYEELLRIYPEVSHVLEHDYVVIRSYEEAEKRLKEWIESPEKLKSIDIESYSTEWYPKSKNRITGVFLGVGEEWSTYFPFRQDNFDYNLPLEFLRKIFDSVNSQPAYPEVIILAHNAKFEIEGFYQEFRDYLRVDVDTYLLGVLVDPVIKKGSHTLKALAGKVDNKFYLELKHIFIGPVMFNVLPPEIVLLYGCPDATSPAKVYKYLMSKLPKDEFFVKRLEMGILYVKAMNEFYGIRMDQERLTKLIEEEQYKVDMLSSIFKRWHHTSRNINSPDVLADILYNKLRCKVEVRTDKGTPATSKFAISRIVETGMQPITEDTVIPKDIVDMNGKSIIKGKDLAGNKYPSLLVYQKYRLCGKELGALNRLQKKSVDGFFQFYINQSGAGSNRQTSDAHQFSETMKSCALADSPYHQLVSCDYKQVELRVLAGEAGQEDLIALESDPSVDIHRAILSIIQGKPMYLISEEDRKAGKSVNFGVVYMMTEYGLARRDFGPGYTQENLITERKKITDFFNGLPKIKQYLKRNEESLKKNGWIRTSFGYYRWFPELLDPTLDPKVAQRLIRSGNNTPVQGYAAQMLKIAETKVWNYIRKKGWDKEKDYDGMMLPMVRMILPIHDEILLSYDKSIPKEEICKMMKECMELDIDGMPPFFAAPAFIDNWYDGKDAAYEVDIEFRDKVIEEYEKGNYLLTGHDYLKVLQANREKELKDYMLGLINKYKTPKEVAKHVTHDSLTHTLIETIDKDIRKTLTHMERIEYATEKFMEALNNDTTAELMEEINTITEDIGQDYIDTDTWASTYSYIDSNGELITEVDTMDGAEEDEVVMTAEEEYDLLNDTQATSSRVIYGLNECIIDLTGLDFSTQGEKANEAIYNLSSDDAYYRVIYILDNGIYPTPYKVDHIPDDIQSIFNNLEATE